MLAKTIENMFFLSRITESFLWRVPCKTGLQPRSLWPLVHAFLLLFSFIWFILFGSRTQQFPILQRPPKLVIRKWRPPTIHWPLRRITSADAASPPTGWQYVFFFFGLLKQFLCLKHLNATWKQKQMLVLQSKLLIFYLWGMKITIILTFFLVHCSLIFLCTAFKLKIKQIKIKPCSLCHTDTSFLLNHLYKW